MFSFLICLFSEGWGLYPMMCCDRQEGSCCKETSPGNDWTGRTGQEAGIPRPNSRLGREPPPPLNNSNRKGVCFGMLIGRLFLFSD